MGSEPGYTREMVELDALLEIMARLRNPDGGCPWDLEQTHSSISPHTIEEAYEVDEAIRSGDPEALRDELGDLLFQVVFQSRIAQERGDFDFAGVVEAIHSKLVRRHPHIFADAERPGTSSGQLANWEDIKAAERAAADPGKEGPPDPFAGIPRHLPALARSAKIAGRIDRLNSAPSAKSRAEQGRHVEAALADLDVTRAAFVPGRTFNADETARDRTARDESAAASSGPTGNLRLVGEGLRAWVHLARALGVDPERALRELDEEEIREVRSKTGNA